MGVRAWRFWKFNWSHRFRFIPVEEFQAWIFSRKLEEKVESDSAGERK